MVLAEASCPFVQDIQVQRVSENSYDISIPYFKNNDNKVFYELTYREG